MVQDLATQWIQPCPCKTKTSQETERSLRKFLVPSEKPKVIFILARWKLGNPVKNYPGIIVHQRHTVLRRMALLRERYAESRKELLPYCCNVAWTKNGGLNPWNVTAICEMFTDLLSDGETPYERRFGEPFRGPVIPFGAMIEDHSMSAKDRSRLHQCGGKVLPGVFLGYALYAGRNLERRHFRRRH